MDSEQPAQRTLVGFLEARISEDEAAARTSVDDPVFGTAEKWEIEPDGPHYLWHTGLGIMVAGSVGDNCIAPAQAEHTVRWDPARVLAECASKRRIVETYVPDGADPHPGQPCTNDIEGDPDGERYAELKQWGEAGACVRHLAAWETHHHSEWVLKLLALPDADHPDFDEAWRL